MIVIKMDTRQQRQTEVIPGRAFARCTRLHGWIQQNPQHTHTHTHTHTQSLDTRLSYSSSHGATQLHYLSMDAQ